MLEKFVKLIHVAYISNIINAKHTLQPLKVTSYHHPIENYMFKVLNNSYAGTFVYWGVYESGKTTAVRNTGLRLQEAGRSVILLHGYDFSWHKKMHHWLKHSVGVPVDTAEPISTFFIKPTTIIIDHFDMMMKDERVDGILEFLRELSIESTDSCKFNILLVVTSWERALQLRKNGEKILDHPTRWTGDHLNALFSTFPGLYTPQWNYQEKSDEILRISTLAGTPGVLIEGLERIPNEKRASILDLEWRKGTLALEGKLHDNIVGRFPDKNGIFHWDDLKSGEECLQLK